MPNRDQTGPYDGDGKRTGRQLGDCEETDEEKKKRKEEEKKE